MWVKMNVSECDFTDRKYKKPVEGAGALAQGATGRWCVVMWAGPEYLEKIGAKVITAEEAYLWIQEHSDGYPDF